MSGTLVFVAHPVSSDPQYNVIKTLRTLRILMDDNPGITFVAPWIDYCLVLNDRNEEHRARGIRDDLVVLRRCDELWLIGDCISSGMQAEAALARELGIEVVDLIGAYE